MIKGFYCKLSLFLQTFYDLQYNLPLLTLPQIAGTIVIRADLQLGSE